MSIPRIQSNLIGELPRPVDLVNLPPPVRPSTSCEGYSTPCGRCSRHIHRIPHNRPPDRAEFRGQMNPQSQQPPVSPPPDTRDLPETPVPQTPTIEVGGVDRSRQIHQLLPVRWPQRQRVPALVSTVIFTQVKSGLDPLIKQLLKPKKKKVKINRSNQSFTLYPVTMEPQI